AWVAVAKGLPIVLPDDWDAFRLRPQGVPVGHTLGRARGTNIPGARALEPPQVASPERTLDTAAIQVACCVAALLLTGAASAPPKRSFGDIAYLGPGVNP